MTATGRGEIGRSGVDGTWAGDVMDIEWMIKWMETRDDNGITSADSVWMR